MIGVRAIRSSLMLYGAGLVPAAGQRWLDVSAQLGLGVNLLLTITGIDL